MDDKQLLEGIISSRQLAFSTFFHSYWKDFYSYVQRIVNDDDESIDILQDTFATLWENREKLAHVQSLKGYVYTIIHHKAVASIKNNIKLRNLKDELYAYFPQHDDRLIHEVNARELATLIQEEIQKLPPRMREIFLLSRNEQLSYREIAQQLAISENTVKKQVSLSLKQLKQRIDNAYVTKSVGAVSICKALALIDQL
ncbi:RNA polymerase sigma factor [Sphingobacterium bambusae]|uniref:RNA polymerase sigma factor n=1 Tax=Sphingobacterium bambusae TaxID=662858 RepID=A0ABW6BA04_9SPHI|nr:RNA polymerase sigma-70 factor [Sphingobacterium bambusae]WPL48639.1 RNA polymerase sigma-70 factor [Sphingobacterium bambusae]